IKHSTGIPYSPTGQAIVERAHRTLKEYLGKFGDISDISERLSKALFVLNHLCIFGESVEPPALLHGRGVTQIRINEAAQVIYREPQSGKWM
ncbi:IGEB protein, partial [Crypturellus undulatus]|nr:IGEB protein [Crypturellus undulatus]